MARSVDRLRSTLTIERYATSERRALDAAVRKLDGSIAKFSNVDSKRVRVTMNDVGASDDDAKARAVDAGQTERRFPGKDGGADFPGFLGVTLRYGEMTSALHLDPGRSDDFALELAVAIRNLIAHANGETLRFGVVSGHGELGLHGGYLVAAAGNVPSIKSVIEQAFPYYQLIDVPLEQGRAMDGNLTGVIVTQPKQSYSEADLRALDSYVLAGGRSLTVFASAASFGSDGHSTLELHGLDRLLEGYGIVMNRDTIGDSEALTLSVQGSERVTSLTFAGLVVVRAAPRTGRARAALPLHASPDFVLPFPSSLTLLADRQPADVIVEAVASTSRSAGPIAAPSLDAAEAAEAKPTSPTGSRVVAAVARGRLRSAFSVKPAERARSSSRVLVIASGLFPVNPFAYAAKALGRGDVERTLAEHYARTQLTSTILTVKHVLDWMASDEDTLACRDE